MNAAIRVLVVDDSPLMRRVLPLLIESDPELRVIATAADGREALTLVERLRPDVITMDVRMPVLDGLATTEQIMAYYPTPILVLTASLSRYDVDITFKMLDAGALDLMEKPANNAQMELARKELVRRLKLLARVRVVTHLRGRRLGNGIRLNFAPQPEAPRPTAFVQPSNPVVIIGASTGGPRIVRLLLAGLPTGFQAPILVVQHIAENFVQGLIDWLNAESPLPVRLATAGQVLVAGTVLVAPERQNMLLNDGYVIALNAVTSNQPTSINLAMASVARTCGSRAIGVLLTGMGSDGAEGLRAIRDAGGYTIAQNKETCTVFGMPRAAIERSAARDVLAPEEIVTTLKRLVGRFS